MPSWRQPQRVWELPLTTLGWTSCIKGLTTEIPPLSAARAASIACSPLKKIVLAKCWLSRVRFEYSSNYAHKLSHVPEHRLGLYQSNLYLYKHTWGLSHPPSQHPVISGLALGNGLFLGRVYPRFYKTYFWTSYSTP